MVLSSRDVLVSCACSLPLLYAGPDAGFMRGGGSNLGLHAKKAGVQLSPNVKKADNVDQKRGTEIHNWQIMIHISQTKIRFCSPYILKGCWPALYHGRHFLKIYSTIHLHCQIREKPKRVLY